jgi:hypothetical protein
MISHSVLAHERRDVGAFRFVVGWIVEPALVEEPNGVDITVTRIADGSNVEGVEQSLKVAISYAGGKFTDPKPLRARFGMPGKYTLDAIPTKAGEYTFHFTGEIEGVKVDEKFVSGPGRFNHVQAKAALMVPEPQPSIGELAAKVDAGNVEPSQPRVVETTASSSDGVARAIGVAGFIVGAVGLVAGILAWNTRSRASS